MKIVRAMKKQARLAGEIKDLQNRIQGSLSTMEENDFSEDYKALTETLNAKLRELITLKIRIMHTNVSHGMYSVIVNLGELKSRLVFLTNLSPEIGVRTSGYVMNPEKIRYKSQITLQDKRQMMDECQEKINQLTDKLDDFNAMTDLNEIDLDIQGI